MTLIAPHLSREIREPRPQGRVNIDTSRAFLQHMVAAGVCRMRHRERPMRDDGTRMAGRCAREYRLHSDFGGLS